MIFTSLHELLYSYFRWNVIPMRMFSTDEPYQKLKVNTMVLVLRLFVLLLQHVRLRRGLFKFNKQIQLTDPSDAGFLLLK